MSRDEELALIAAFDRVTHCPPVYLVPTKQGGPDWDEQSRRAADMPRPVKRQGSKMVRRWQP